ncbi:MAG: Vitamin B12-dependent ribonucleoside-diphosphate reductase [Phycisphaerae bacterium]|nr:Vitamin B12-dependent ribonucleoside-diphosphate reductase [Phycisphaerae bacterium]
MTSLDDMNAVAPELSANARRVLEDRYLRKDETGRVVETPQELFDRVSRTLAEVEAIHGADDGEVALWRRRFYGMMASRRFLPSSPTLMNAGRQAGTLSACFVLPVPDSVEGIFESIRDTALIQKAGGGTGFAFDELRPAGDSISGNGGTASGPISFLKAFSEATNAIQRGVLRRGANMGMMAVDHPDILKFLNAKQDLACLTNYNLSVKITDEWMEGLLADPDAAHVVRNPRTGERFLLPRSLDIHQYDLRSLPAADGQGPGAAAAGRFWSRGDVWRALVANAHATGEPGVVFIDRINQANPTPHVGRMEATNPCGEQPLLPYEACNLGSVNLAAFVDSTGPGVATVDWEGLGQAIRWAVRLLDNVIDANRYPLPRIAEMCDANRKIGLGVMGYADALFKLGVPYDSEEGAEWGRRFMGFVQEQAHAAGEELAEQRGCFANWPGSTWQTVHRRKMRNACSTAVAPTGTISIIANCSAGIEPVFSLAFVRNVMDGQRLIEINPVFERVARAGGFHSDELMERIARVGSLAEMAEVPEPVRRLFVCAHDFSPEWHLRQQAAFQESCDSAVSKTINFPREATVEQVDRVYRRAYQLRCKGVTVYRDGCRDRQPMALVNADARGELPPGMQADG